VFAVVQAASERPVNLVAKRHVDKIIDRFYHHFAR
jgi:hypothetical protein